MPELPEVETLRRDLSRTVINQTIKSVEVHQQKMLIGDSQEIINHTINHIYRRGKLLIIHTQNQDSHSAILIHLKMTGQLVFKSQNIAGFALGHPIPPLNTPMPNKSTKITITFQSNDILYFNDIRTFGYLKIIDQDKIAHDTFLKTIGIEPFDQKFTKEYLTMLITKSPNLIIKPFLLDQTKIAGLGNIYTDEALFYSKIHPTRTTGSLTISEISLLYDAIKQVLQKGIDHHGASKTSYVTLDGGQGTFLANVAVYQRQGKPCERCKTPIAKIKLRGRGTHFCPQCQQVTPSST